MNDLFNRHIELVELVNNAKTKTEHSRLMQYLNGFRDMLDTIEVHDLVAVDNFYLNKGIDRPMCCGVWLDWEPEDKAQHLIAVQVEQVAWPIMGNGNVAVGQCKDANTNVPGIIYLRLEESRHIGTDTRDVYPVGQPAPDGQVLACIYFLTPQAIQQSIEVLAEMQLDIFPDF